MRRSPLRVLGLDTFRGIAVTMMIFVRAGGGGYWFFQPSKWNGFTLADIIEPWFVFMVGISLTLSFNSLESKRVTRCGYSDILTLCSSHVPEYCPKSLGERSFYFLWAYF